MKNTIKTILLLLTFVAAAPLPLLAHGDHDHKHEKKTSASKEEKRQAGPNGGRVVSKNGVVFEILIQADRHVRLTRLDATLKPAPLADASAKATGGDRSAPVTLAFAAKDGALLSDKPLPEGNLLPLVVQLKPAAKAKTITERLTVNVAQCPTCDFQEYACTCAH